MSGDLLTSKGLDICPSNVITKHTRCASCENVIYLLLKNCLFFSNINNTTCLTIVLTSSVAYKILCI